MKNSDPKWYVVRCDRNREHLLEFGLNEQHYHTYSPTIAIDSRQGRAAGVESLFPGYLFVLLEFGVDDPAPIKNTKWSRGLIRFGESPPCPLPSGWIEQLKSDEFALSQVKAFKPGDRVYISGGILDRYAGIIEEKVGEKRGFLLLDAMEHQITVDLRDLRLEN